MAPLGEGPEDRGQYSKFPDAIIILSVYNMYTIRQNTKGIKGRGEKEGKEKWEKGNKIRGGGPY